MLASRILSLLQQTTRLISISVVSTIPILVIMVGIFMRSTCQSLAQKTTAFLPEGPTIMLDSLFRPNAQYPFDRKFWIEMPLPSDGRLQYFSMTPINGRGEVDIKQKDRRKFLRLMYPEPASLDSMLRNPFFSLSNIRKRGYGLLFDIPKDKTTAGKTKLTLPVLPLDPNREYKLTLFGTDQLMAEQYIDIVRKVLSSKDKLASGDVMAAHVLMHEAEIDYFKSSSEFRSRSSFDPTSFQQYISELTAFRFTITPATSPKSTIKEYSLFITSKNDAPVADDFAAEG
jgi:hypothetical protein